jgi:hypothetical protein
MLDPMPSSGIILDASHRDRLVYVQYNPSIHLLFHLSKQTGTPLSAKYACWQILCGKMLQQISVTTLHLGQLVYQLALLFGIVICGLRAMQAPAQRCS